MRSTKAIIDKSAIKNNIAQIKAHYPNQKILALVKANAYGHDLIQMSKELEKNGIDHLGVAYINEAVLLRKSGIKAEIIVLVPELNDVNLYFDYNLQPAVSTFEFLEKLNDFGINSNQKISTHIYLDTGMSRDGFNDYEIDKLINKIPNLTNIHFNGIFTHLSSAASDNDFSYNQIWKFKEIIKKFADNNIKFNFYHIANSGAISNLDINEFNMIRIGLSLYGYPPVNQNLVKLDFKPILTLETKIIMVRKIKNGDPVSYDRLFIAVDDCNIATIPIGYGDGYSKLLTNRTYCLINGKKYPIVGAICMDECMVNLGIDEFEIGTKVTLIGNNGELSISAYDLANTLGTIPYEITTQISSRVQRIYV